MDKLKHPEIQPGIRIAYHDKRGKFRANRVVKRWGNQAVTVIDAVKVKERVPLKNIIGYWPKRVRANFQNLVKLEEVMKCIKTS